MIKTLFVVLAVFTSQTSFASDYYTKCTFSPINQMTEGLSDGRFEFPLPRHDEEPFAIDKTLILENKAGEPIEVTLNGQMIATDNPRGDRGIDRDRSELTIAIPELNLGNTLNHESSMNFANHIYFDAELPLADQNLFTEDRVSVHAIRYGCIVGASN